MVVKMVQCPVCQRLFADQLSPQGNGYRFPSHAMNAHPGKRERLKTCPGSGKPIATSNQVKVERVTRCGVVLKEGKP